MIIPRKQAKNKPGNRENIFKEKLSNGVVPEYANKLSIQHQ